MRNNDVFGITEFLATYLAILTASFHLGPYGVYFQRHIGIPTSDKRDARLQGRSRKLTFFFKK